MTLHLALSWTLAMQTQEGSKSGIKHWVLSPLLGFVALSFLAGAISAWGMSDAATAFLVMSFIAAVLNWPFVVLFFVTLNKSYEEHPSTGSVRSAMRYSVIAMIAENILFYLVVTWLELPLLPLLLLNSIFLAPAAGWAGWSAGRIFYRHETDPN
jgi:hypothetical protein